MATIAEIIDAIEKTPGCRLEPPIGMPELPEGVALPADVREFYERAGGALLFSDRVVSGPVRILGPGQVERIDQKIIREQVAGPFQWWYAIVEVGDRSYVAIDLSPQHAGLCYDAFRETFARPGYANVIASSFSDLLERLLAHKEDSTYWLDEEFKPLGEGFGLHGYKTIS